MKLIHLIHGDCIEEMKKLDDNSIDMCLADPPYGTTACKWDNVIPFEPMWKELKRIVKDNGAICLFGSEPFSSSLRMSNIKMFKYDWVWEKDNATNFLLAKKQPMKYTENISVFAVKEKYYPIKWLKGRIANSSRSKKIKKGGYIEHTNIDNIKHESKYRYPKNIIYFNKCKHNDGINGSFHPTQKPVALLEYLIKTYTLENETVLDFTMGSGSTGVAAKNLNRKFIGIENNTEYFNIAKKRISDA